MKHQKRNMAAFTIAFLLTSILAAPATLGAAEPESDDLPTPNTISEAVAESCADLMRWELDALDHTTGLLWRAEYARCGIDAVHESGILHRIGEHCQDHQESPDETCLAQVLEEQRLKPQLAALIEACTVINHVRPSGCSYGEILGPLGIHTQSQSLPRYDCLDDVYLPVSDYCDPVARMKEQLCRSGLCLEGLIGVRHQGWAWPPVGSGVCGGAHATLETSASGFVITTGFFTYFRVSSSSSVSVAWELTCEANPGLEGKAWGGFMRELDIVRGSTHKTVCQYDGLIEWGCEGTHTEGVAAEAAGAYDADKSEGRKKPLIMTLDTRSGGEWKNVQQGSLKVVEIFDSASAVLSGNQDYAVEYKDSGDLSSLFGALGISR